MFNYNLFKIFLIPFLSLSLLLLLLLCSFSCVWTPQTAAHQAPPSLEFSRQEYWSGLPLHSPIHESEKSKWSRSVVSDSWRPHGLQPTRFLCQGDFPGKSTGVGCHCHDHYNSNIGAFDIAPDISETILSSFHSFYFILLFRWRRKWYPDPVFLPRDSRGQRSLVGCFPWGRTESDMT